MPVRRMFSPENDCSQAPEGKSLPDGALGCMAERLVPFLKQLHQLFGASLGRLSAMRIWCRSTPPARPVSDAYR
jgi:hypothetical protein